MAKRKKQQSSDPPRKRAKGAAEQYSDSSQEYKIKTILDENKHHYLIDWEDGDDGEHFAPTWEPKRNANEQAIADWKAQKAAKSTASATPPVKRRGRPRKVVHSSPESPVTAHKPSDTVQVRPAVIESSAQTGRESQAPANATVSDTEFQALEIVESQPEPAVDSQASSAAESLLVEPEVLAEAAVNVDAPPSSFAAGAYQAFPSSQRLQESLGLSSEPAVKEVVTEEVADLPAASSTPQRIAEAEAPLTQPESGPKTTEAVATIGAEAGDSEASPPSSSLIAGFESINGAPAEISKPSAQETEGSVTAETVPEHSDLQPHSTQQHIESVETRVQLIEDGPQAEAGALNVPAADNSGVIPDSQSLQDSSTLLTETDAAVHPGQTDDTKAETHRRQVSQTSVSFSTFESSIPFLTQISIVPRAASLPALSPLASVPSHSAIEELGDSAPPRPRTPSTPLSVTMSMAAQQTPSSSSSLAARLKALRERRQLPSATEGTVPASPFARLRAEQNHDRSPSVVPAIEREEPITQDEMNTSERYKTLIPRDQEQTNGSAHLTNTVSTVSLREKSASTQSYMVPIALMGHQRDQYPATVYYHKDLIQRFLETTHPDAELIAQAELIVEQLHNVALHPDLVNPETFTQYDTDPQHQAQWDVDCSAKFRFLKTFLDELRGSSDHVIIVAADGPIMRILDTFLTGWKIPHRRAGSTGHLHVDNDQVGFLVTLVSRDIDQRVEPQPIQPAHLIIAMSPSMGDDEHVRNALGQECAMLTLVVPYTVEHVDYSLSASLMPAARLKALISAVYRLKYDAGKLEEDQSNLDNAAHEIAKYLRQVSESQDVEFPIVGLTPLHSLDSQTESDDSSTGQKRLLELDDSIESSKRTRTMHKETDAELPITVNPQEIEITHISDSIEKPTQSQPLSMTDAAQRLQGLLDEAHGRIEELDSALSELQYRHEDQREQLVKITGEHAKVHGLAEQALARFTEKANANSEMNSTVTALKEQLESANAKLLQHHVPERAELEAARLDAEQARAEQIKTEKQLKKAQTDLTYAQSAYQSASQTASGLATQNSELESRLELSERRASGEQVKLRQLGFDARTRLLEAENKRLKGQQSDLEAGIKCRDEEIARLKEASRGRMGTRGTSIPRSPRLGSPMKSRHGSPAAGEIKGKGVHLHPLRNG